jgi:hypothetical protein
MLEFFKSLWTDEKRFISTVRGGLMLIGGIAASGTLPPEVPQWAGAIAMGLGGMIRAGDKNPK